MKHFVTLVACLASFIALAQNPNYDPDSNGDDLIGAQDLQSLLALYNTMLTSNQAVVGYVTDLEAAGTFVPIYNSETIYYNVPDSVDFLCFPPGEDGEVFVVLNSSKRQALTTAHISPVRLYQDSIVKVESNFSAYSPYGLSADYLVTWLFIDGRWWPH